MGDERVSGACARAKRLEIDDRSKLVIISDCHRGTGTGADDFAHNQKLYYTAMRHYFRSGYTYIELGDGDELLEEKHFGDIAAEYDHVFGLLAAMYREGRLHLIYGNHDMVKKNPRWTRANLTEYRPGHQMFSVPLFPNITVEESILLTHGPTGREILLLHGHQADFFNDRMWKQGRFLVRYLWRPLELVGVRDPTSTALNPRRRGKVERMLEGWADRTGKLVIAGHTHRPVFPEAGKGFYYNDGSCVHPRYITAMEISGGGLSLVKWEVAVKPDGLLYITKEVMYGPRAIEECFAPQPERGQKNADAARA